MRQHDVIVTHESTEGRKDSTSHYHRSSISLRRVDVLPLVSSDSILHVGVVNLFPVVFVSRANVLLHQTGAISVGTSSASTCCQLAQQEQSSTAVACGSYSHIFHLVLFAIVWLVDVSESEDAVL